jgi:GNAT superfamily N-acetyltransferase
LVVLRSARGTGVARRLMEEAERQAVSVGKTPLVLDTVTGGAAERLYEKLGKSRRHTEVRVVPRRQLDGYLDILERSGQRIW